MAELPAVNSLLYITVSDDFNCRSRVEDVDGQLLTVAAPVGSGDLQIPDDGTELKVFWTGIRARYVLPVQMVGQTRDNPPRWHLRALGEPVRQTRRNFVRGGGGGPAEIVPTTTGEGESSTSELLRGKVVDISEGGVRCRLQQASLTPGDPVVVRVQLGERSLEIAGTIISTRPDQDQSGVDVVVTYQPPEPDAQAIRRYVFQWEIAERRRRLDAESDSVR